MIRLPDFSKARVLVAGDIMLDSYWHGQTKRISPEAPVPVVQIGKQDVRPGGAGNVAINLGSLGVQTTLLGLVGDDAAGSQLEKALEGYNIQTSLRRVAGSKTVTKLRVVSQHQQIIRLDFDENFPSLGNAPLLHEFRSAVKQSDVVILSDYAKGALRNVNELIAEARAAGRPVIIDPKGEDFERYRGATLLTPNLQEFEAVAGRCTGEEELANCAEGLRSKLQLQALLITRGEQGMTLVAEGQPPSHLPAHAREVFDVTGAGDTVAALLGAGLAAGLDMINAVAISNVAAGIVVGKLGTASVTPGELEAALGTDQYGAQRNGIFEIDRAIKECKLARSAGKKIVMTNGCFDMLHPGHVAYLEQARALGDRLLVAINDDESVRRLKGSAQGVRRPVNPLVHRMQMLAALSCVDWVVAFSEDTPENLIAQILPDILVKGGDYLPEQIAGGRYVISAGGEVRVLPFQSGYSTSKIIERIRREGAP